MSLTAFLIVFPIALSRDCRKLTQYVYVYKKCYRIIVLVFSWWRHLIFFLVQFLVDMFNTLFWEKTSAYYLTVAVLFGRILWLVFLHFNLTAMKRNAWTCVAILSENVGRSVQRWTEMSLLKLSIKVKRNVRLNTSVVLTYNKLRSNNSVMNSTCIAYCFQPWCCIAACV